MSEVIDPVIKKRKNKKLLSKQVAMIAGSFVSKKRYVSAADLFLGIGWLTQDKLSDWKAGKIPYLERVITANLKRYQES